MVVFGPLELRDISECRYQLMLFCTTGTPLPTQGDFVVLPPSPMTHELFIKSCKTLSSGKWGPHSKKIRYSAVQFPAWSSLAQFDQLQGVVGRSQCFEILQSGFYFILFQVSFNFVKRSDSYFLKTLSAKKCMALWNSSSPEPRLDSCRQRWHVSVESLKPGVVEQTPDQFLCLLPSPKQSLCSPFWGSYTFDA